MDEYCELFDAIAPIHIYFKADLMFKSKAVAGLEKLRTTCDFRRLRSMFFDMYEWMKGSKNYPDIDDILNNFLEAPLDDIYYHDLWSAYNYLFEQIVGITCEDLGLDVTYSNDYYGALTVKLNGRELFVGDTYDCYPFYQNSRSLINKVKEELSNESPGKLCSF